MTNYTKDQHKKLGMAISVASLAHNDQVDKSGVPIIFHVLNVAYAHRNNPTEAIVAVLHDTVEDSELTTKDVRKHFGDEIASAVDALTHRAGETYDEYIERLSYNPIAVAVKKSDLLDNMDLDRQNFEGHEKLFGRHLKAYQRLCQESCVKRA